MLVVYLTEVDFLSFFCYSFRTNDEIENMKSNERDIPLSATNGDGLIQLLQNIQAGLLKLTGRGQYRINIDQEGDELGFVNYIIQFYKYNLITRRSFIRIVFFSVSLFLPMHCSK